MCRLHPTPIHRGGYCRCAAFSLANILRIVRFLNTLLCTLTVTRVPEVGPVFDCTLVSHGRAYRFDDDLASDQTFGKNFGSYSTFHAKVQQYYLTKTDVKLYHCSSMRVILGIIFSLIEF